MTVMEVIQGRRSIRKYQDKPVEQEKLYRILEAMRLAPSAKNLQDRIFVVVRDKEKRLAIADTCLDYPAFIRQAPVLIICCGTNHGIMTCGHRADSVDLTIAMSFGILEATELGLGTCFIASHAEDKLRGILNLPESFSTVIMTTLGYPDQEPAARPRKPLDQQVHYDGYDQ